MSTSTPLRRRLIVPVLMLGGLLMALQSTVVVPLLPHFSEIFGASRSDVGWIVTVGLLTGSVLMPVVTRMADMYGKKLMLLVAVGSMIAGSLLAIATPWLGVMLVGRALQGVSMAIIPIAVSIMRETVSPRRLPTSIGLMSATMGIGSTLGLPVVGALYVAFGWQMAFVLCAAVGTVAFVAVVVCIPESSSRRGGRFDVAGALLLGVSLLSVLLVLSKGSSFGWFSPLTLALIASALVFGSLWWWSQLRVSNPLIDLRTLRRRPVALTNAYSLLIGFAMMAHTLMITYQLQLPPATGYGLGLDTFSATLAMIPSGLVLVGLAPVSGALVNRFGARMTLILGAAIAAAGYASISLWHNSLIALIAGMCVLSAGTALAYAAQPTMIMANVPATELAASNGINSLMRTTGFSLISALSAGMLATFTLPLTVAGEPLPSWTGFGISYAVVIGTCLVALGLAVAIPRSADTLTTRAQGQETVGASPGLVRGASSGTT